MIRGQMVILYEKVVDGTDDFNRTVYAEAPVRVENVIIAPVSAEAVINELSISGKHLAYNLMIPKGDTHDWLDCRVSFFGKDWHVFGDMEEWMDVNVPGRWNRRLKVERYA